MSIFRITLVLDDSVAAQATLLASIQTALASIASNLPPAGSGGINNIEVRKIA